MASIFELMKALNYPTDERGVCHGLAIMAERARRCHDYKTFKKRMDYLDAVNVDDFKIAMNLLQAKVKAKNVLTKHEKMLLTIQPFFFQLWAYQSPDEIQKFLGVERQVIAQDNLLTIEKTLQEDNCLTIPKEYCFFTDHTQDKKKNSVKYLSNFLEAIQTASFPTGLLVATAGHEVHVFYDNKKKKWFLTNHSILSSHVSQRSLMKALTAAFDIEKFSSLRIRVFCHQPTKKNRLFRALNAIESDSLQALMKNGDPNRSDTENFSPLSFAVRENFVDIVKVLLNHPNIKINKYSRFTALYNAVLYDNYRIAKILLSQPTIDVNLDENFRAEVLEFLEAYQALQIEPCLNVNPKIFEAAQGVLKQLALHPGSIAHDFIDEIASDQLPLLLLATMNSNVKMAKFLLSQPTINVNDARVDGLTPLLCAINNSELEIALALLQHVHIDVNQHDNDGLTPLKAAVVGRQLILIETLLSRDDINLNELDSLMKYAKLYKLQNVICLLEKYMPEMPLTYPGQVLQKMQQVAGYATSWLSLSIFGLKNNNLPEIAQSQAINHKIR